jgi:hypothetical protein
MSWFRRNRPQQAPAPEIARLFHHICVTEAADPVGNRPGDYNIPDAFFDQFDERMREYRTALVLYVLSSKAQDDAHYEAVLQAYDAIILPRKDTPEGGALMLKLNEIMRALDFVIRTPGENLPLSWAAAWFADLGLDVSNPVILTKFLTHWMGSFIGVRRAIDQVAPA